jgi:hypothetical protein
MFADLKLLVDLFMRRNPIHPEFLIKTHPRQLPSVQFFIDHYTKAHPAVSIIAKGFSYLALGEYEVHIQPRRLTGNSAKQLASISQHPSTTAGSRESGIDRLRRPVQAARRIGASAPSLRSLVRNAR